MTILRRSMLAHAYGPEYGLHEPYVCEGCKKTISQHGEFPSECYKEELDYLHMHFSQRHGRPPAQQVAI